MAIRYRASALLLGIAGAAVAANPAHAASDNEQQNLSNLSIEELAQLPVRSASKTDQPLSSAATALYVITSDDIARSPATSLPEALRLAPNLWVQRTDARQYAISARGFNGIETANKLLALVDGRSIYSTLHSGIFWELDSPTLEDIAQIEVISGPGGTLYGPNAVNGVINVTTKDARDTLGALLRSTVDNRERTAAARYGFALGQNGAVRLSANYFDREGLPAGATADLSDGMRGWQGGLRADFGPDTDHVMFKAEAFNNDTFQIAGEGNHGHNATLRWNKALDGSTGLQLQAYYDMFRRRSLLTEDFLETWDAEAQINAQTGPHQIVAGLGARTTRDRFINDLNAFQLAPQRARLWLFNGFVQDHLALSQQVSAIVGVKVERSSFSGFEVLPNLRLAWQPSASAMLWASVSRAVRTPSRIDRDLTDTGLLASAPAFRSEKLVAFELGYRGQPSRSTSLSINGFFNLYDDLRSFDFINNAFPLQLRNDLQGHTYGVEAWGNQQVTRWWRLSAGVAWLAKRFHVRPGTRDLSAGASLGHDPDYQFQLRSQMNLPGGFTFDTALRRVDGQQEAPAIPGYTEADARLGWSAGRHVELFVSGDNLLHTKHLESNDAQRSQAVVRAVYLGARLRF